METFRTITDTIATLLGMFQCLTLILPMGFYAIEPPPSYVGTLWGFLEASTYITFIVGVLLLFRYQIQTHLHLKANIMIILSGIITILIFFIGSFLYPFTQTLIEGFHQVITNTGIITYLDVEIGGIFKYFSFGVGFFCLGLGVWRYNRDHLEALNSEKPSF